MASILVYHFTVFENIALGFVEDSIREEARKGGSVTLGRNIEVGNCRYYDGTRSEHSNEKKFEKYVAACDERSMRES